MRYDEILKENGFVLMNPTAAQEIWKKAYADWDLTFRVDFSFFDKKEFRQVSYVEIKSNGDENGDKNGDEWYRGTLAFAESMIAKLGGKHCVKSVTVRLEK